MKADEGFDRSHHKIEWIPVRQISVIWAQSQREFDEKHAARIAEAFDPDMFGTLAVTKPNGKGIYHAIDGQHRRAAVEKLWGGDEKVPCEVFDASNPARAAKLFDTINSARKKPQPIQSFKVRVTAGDKTEVAVNNLVVANGYTIGNSASDRCISSVAALVAVYRSHGPDALDATLKIIQSTWGLDRNAVVAPIIRGYGEFMSEHGRHANWQRLKDVIAKKFTPGRFVGAAKTAREMEGGSMSSAIKKLLLANYNRGLKQSKHIKSKTADERAAEQKTLNKRAV